MDLQSVGPCMQVLAWLRIGLHAFGNCPMHPRRDKWVYWVMFLGALGSVHQLWQIHNWFAITCTGVVCLFDLICGGMGLMARAPSPNNIPAGNVKGII